MPIHVLIQPQVTLERAQRIGLPANYLIPIALNEYQIASLPICHHQGFNRGVLAVVTNEAAYTDRWATFSLALKNSFTRKITLTIYI